MTSALSHDSFGIVNVKNPVDELSPLNLHLRPFRGHFRVHFGMTPHFRSKFIVISSSIIAKLRIPRPREQRPGWLMLSRERKRAFISSP
jgi:hypothetical protein